MAKLFIILSFYVCCIQLITSDDETTPTVTTPIPTLQNDERSAESNTTTEVPEVTLEDLEKSLKNAVENAFSRALSFSSGMGGIPSDVSFSCLLSFLKIYYDVKDLKPWVFQMLDSSGKFSGGILEGTSSALGDYDECLDVVVGGGKPGPGVTTGSYCLLEIKPPEPVLNALKDFQINKRRGNTSLAFTQSFLGLMRRIRSNPNHVMFRMGLCMPSVCNKEDVQNIINRAVSSIDIAVNVARCEKKEAHKFQIHEILIMIFLCNIIALCIVGTLIDLIYNKGGCMVQDDSGLDPGPNAMKLKNRWRRSKLFEILSSFSVCTSIKRLLVCDEEGDALDVVRGVKVFTVISTIYFHTYGLPHPLHLYRFRSSLNVSKFVDEFLFATVANASVGVDTFFFLGGFLFIFYRWRLIKKPPVFMYTLKFLSVNYFRFLSAQVLVGLIFALFPIIGSGPLWDEFVEEPLRNCAKNSWMNALFIQNFLSPYDSCLYHTWILSTMMQLFFVTSFLVWLIHRKPNAGIAVTTALIIAAILAVSIVTVIFDFPATFTVYFYDFRNSVKYWKYLYVQSYNHIGPFCIGMLCAYFIADYPPLKTKKPITICLWIASIVTCGAIIFGLYGYRGDKEMNPILVVIYSAVHRPAWAVAIGWMLYACATENGGFIGSILTWKALIPMERLCYLAYLLHVPIMYYHGGVQRERMYMGKYNQVMCFFSYIIASFVLSFLCYIFFQSPYLTMESYIIGVNKDNIWQTDPPTTSTESLKTDENDKDVAEDNSKVLYSRYTQNIIY